MPSEQHRAVGAVIISEPGKPTIEYETHTCVHCNGFFMTKGPGVDPAKASGWCGQCFALICIGCAKTGRCTPFERRLAAVEARGRLFESMGLTE